MAPVGSYESLAAAIQAGADSVYFGVGKLNMRSASAANFTLDDLAKIVATARAAGVKTYLTVNTIVYEDELRTVHEVIDRAKAEGIDAVIASDFAAILYARRIGVEVHISTQSNISNSEAVKFFSQWADTVVLARARTGGADSPRNRRERHPGTARRTGSARNVRPRRALHVGFGQMLSFALRDQLLGQPRRMPPAVPPQIHRH